MKENEREILTPHCTRSQVKKLPDTDEERGMQHALPLVLVPLWSYRYIPTSEEKLPFLVDGSRYFNTAVTVVCGLGILSRFKPIK